MTFVYRRATSIVLSSPDSLWLCCFSCIYRFLVISLPFCWITSVLIGGVRQQSYSISFDLTQSKTSSFIASSFLYIFLVLKRENSEKSNFVCVCHINIQQDFLLFSSSFFVDVVDHLFSLRFLFFSLLNSLLSTYLLLLDQKTILIQE